MNELKILMNAFYSNDSGHVFSKRIVINKDDRKLYLAKGDAWEKGIE